jgi:hypothetical protein
MFQSNSIEAVSMQFIIVKQGAKIVFDSILEDPTQGVIAPLFQGEKYEIEVYDSNAQKIQSSQVVAAKSGVTLKLVGGVVQTVPADVRLLSDYVNQLVFRGMDDELKQKLLVVGKMHPEIQYNMDTVRGGRLEHLFYLLLLELKKQKVVGDVIWHGGLDRYGMPHPAPGRSKFSLGNPDVLVEVDNMIVVLELTLIGKTRAQWSYEGESVPDHVLGVKNANPNKEVIGVFSAPDFYRPEHLRAVAAYSAYSVVLKLCSIDQLISILTKLQTKTDFTKAIRSLP